MAGAKFTLVSFAPAKALTITSDSLLADAATLFFAAWSVIVAGLAVAAFGRDFLPNRPSDKAEALEKSSSRMPGSLR